MGSIRRSLVAGVFVVLALAGCQTPQQSSAARPNILLIVVDDVGFNDLGVFGGEIATPTIDALAAGGTVLTNFHVAPNCSPTRAMLLSGTDSHVAGLGNMAEEQSPNQLGKPGYEGYLNFRVAALPEVLSDAGYATYMTGKWHLGLTDETSPAARGFDRSFALLQGGAGAFANMLPIIGPEKAMYRENGELLNELPDDFYSTRFYTDRMIEYIDSGAESGKPFFAYLAYAAPHWPLQAPAESIARYKGRYDGGYDRLHAERLERLRTLGLVDDDAKPFQRLPGEPAWDELSADEQRIEARKMEVFAAMVDDVDRYLTRLIDHLKSKGLYDDTVIVFLSDNGPEAHHLDRGWDALADWVDECCDNSYENIGKADSYVWYGPNWGRAGNAPLRMFKGFTSQGGIRVPAFVHFPKAFPGGTRSDAMLTVRDIMPTLLELAGAEHPGERFRGRDVVAMQGRSMAPILRGENDEIHTANDFFGWELFGKRAIRQGDWKIIYEPYHEVLEPRPDGILTNQWQLYNLENDPAEINDLARTHPEKLAELIALWERYERENGVIIPDQMSGY